MWGRDPISFNSIRISKGQETVYWKAHPYLTDLQCHVCNIFGFCMCTGQFLISLLCPTGVFICTCANYCSSANMVGQILCLILIYYYLHHYWTSLIAQVVKNPTAMQETLVWFSGWEDSLEKGMAIHSRILAWKSPWTEKLDGLQSMGSQWVGHDWMTNTFTFFSRTA